MNYSNENKRYDVLDHEYKTLMSVMHVSVGKYLLDDYFTLLWANDYFYERTGYTREELETRFHNRVSEYYQNDPDILQTISDVVTSAFQTGQKQYEHVCKMPRKDGSYIWIKMIGMFTDEIVEGKPVIYTVFTDVTDLVRSQKEQSVTYDNLPGFVAKFRLKGNRQFEFVEGNERFIRFFGARGENDPPYSLFNLDTEGNRQAISENYAMMQEGEPVHFVVQVKNRSGEDAWLQLNAECIEWIDNDPVYLVVYIDITDVTELRELKKKLEERTEMLRKSLEMTELANQAKSDFLSRMSHDIRTPMNAIIGLTAIAKNSLSANNKAKAEESLDKLETSARLLLSLINDILDMSKIDNGKTELQLEKLDFVTFIKDLASLFYARAEHKRVSFSLQVSDKIREFYIADASKLKQIVFNILDNAVKYTENGGNVELAIDEGRINDDARELVFTVTDTGIGMNTETVNRIFQPFEQDTQQRGNHGGSGLGLTIANNFIHLMNGSIDVKSEPEKGSRFTVRVWVEADNTARETIPSRDEFSDCRVLVFEEDADYGKYIVDKLTPFGTKTQTVDSAEEVIKTLAKAKADRQPFHILLMEWKWPHRELLNLAKTIRNRHFNEIAVGVSSYDIKGIRSEAQKAGIHYFLQKPLFLSTVREFLQSVRESRARQEKSAQGESLSGRRVLLVEDNAMNMEVAKTLLESRQLKVDTARNGQEAMEKFLTSRPNSYLAILMDIQMPVMNGLEATRMIRRFPRTDAKTVPIIAMSANAFDDDIRKSLEAGMNVHLSKPIDLPLLFDVLQQYAPNDKLS